MLRERKDERVRVEDFHSMLEFYRMLRVKTIDAHAAGEPLRLIVDGFPSPRGRTMANG